MSRSDILTLSLSARILVNAEALNMAESVGNVARHRRAPMIVEIQSGYAVFYVPAVSGESIAYHYQKHLVDIASAMDLPLTDMDKRGYFLKYADDNIINKYYPEVKKIIDETNMCDIEKVLVESSVVADIGGFLYTNKLVKRISRVRFSYMLPALDAVKKGATASYPQLHVRYSPEATEKEQAIYYVESGSSLYTFSAVLNISDIGRLEYCNDILSDRANRIEAALRALLVLIDGISFGAKRSRYQPLWEVRSMIVGMSRGPTEFTVSPATRPSYVEHTVRRARVFKNKLANSDVRLILYDSESLPVPDDLKKDIEICKSHSEALEVAMDEAIRDLKQAK